MNPKERLEKKLKLKLYAFDIKIIQDIIQITSSHVNDNSQDTFRNNWFNFKDIRKNKPYKKLLKGVRKFMKELISKDNKYKKFNQELKK
jgi:hypothetical protein